MFSFNVMTFARPEWNETREKKNQSEELHNANNIATNTVHRPKKIDNLSRGGKIDVNKKQHTQTQREKKQQNTDQRVGKTAHLR